MYISDTHLKSFLADAGLVSQKDFDAAETEAKETGKPIGEILTAHNAIGEDEREKRENVVANVAVDRARETSQKSVEHLQRAEVELNLVSPFVQCELPGSRQPFHILVRLDEAPPLSFFVHVALQFL